MSEFNITYKSLIDTHKSKTFEYDEAYKELILPIKDSFEEIDSIIDFVRRWNTRVPIGKNKDKIKEVVLTLKDEFIALKNYNIENFKFNQKNIRLVKKIFDKLCDIKLESPKKTTSFGGVGTSKLIHGINPNLFVMWDNGISEHYGCYPNSTGYINFMRLMQEEILNILKKHRKDDIIKETNKTLPKLLDEYNWINFRTSKSFKN